MGKNFLKGFFLSVAAVFVFGTCGIAADTPLLKEADQLREEKSYQMAAEKYRQILSEVEKNGPAAKIAREVNFKLGDCLWRANQQGTAAPEAEKMLKDLAEDKDADRWQAEAGESLAEYYLQVDRWSHTEQIKSYLENARDYWAGATDVELARKRFVTASFTLGDFISQNWGWYYTGLSEVRYGEKAIARPPQAQPAGLEVLYEEILKIATDPADKAKAHYALAMSYQSRFAYDPEKKKLIEKHFKEVVDRYPQSEWLDDALFYLGQYHEQASEFKPALEAFQQLLSRFKPGESQWLDNARERVKQITGPALSAGVGYTFLPDSEIQFSLNWRNISQAKVTIYKMDLVHELNLNMNVQADKDERGVDQYSKLLKSLVDSGRYQFLPVVVSWQESLKEEGKHLPYGESKGLAEWRKEKDDDPVDPAMGVLPPGAYLLLVTAGDVKAYDLILVTEMGVAAKTSARSALFYAFDGATGSPKPEAQVKYHYRYYDTQGHWMWDEGSGVTDASGLLKVELKNPGEQYNNQHDLFAVASDGAMQAFVQGSHYGSGGSGMNWSLYSYSDRPAYRPNEQVSFKGIVRRYDGAAFTNTTGMKVKTRIYDPRGNIVREKDYVLNDFGTFDDKLSLDGQAALGEYRMEVYTDNWNQHIGNSPLFRLEEYKLPEFLVNIKPKPKDGKVSTYQLGDKIVVELDAQYYFGGPVAGADIEYLIYQSPYYHTYYPAREYEWYYRDMRSNYYDYGGGQLVTQGKIKTDKDGKATFEFETPKDSPNDLKYRVEARVVDQSRREITATGEIKVTKNAFYAYLTPKQNLYHPGDKAEVDIKIMTANGEPVSVDGKVAVLRNWWDGPRMEGDKIVREGQYGNNELFSKFVKTDAKGEAKFEFQPEQDGYYTVQFTGFDAGGKEVLSSAVVYVCAKQSQDIGFRFGGMQIIAEKDTYMPGETARFMIVSDQPESWVLFSAEAQEILDYQMLHLTGAVKLLEVPIQANFIPNIFVTAVSSDHFQMKTHSLPIIVPPEEKFLNVRISSDKEVYGPRDEGKFSLEVTDKDGEPVSGEISLGIVDASVYYIQNEYVPDIREFYYGQKRQLSVTTQTSFQQRTYTRLVRGEKGELITEDQRRYLKDSKERDLAKKAETEVSARSGEKILGDERLRSDVSFAAMDAVGGMAEGKMRAASAPMVSRSLAKPMEEMAEKQSKDKEDIGKGNRNEKGPLAQAETRTDFRSTVIWQPSIVTDAEGRASLTVTFPDSLTTWRATARAITRQTTVGNVTQETRTKKDIIVRLQAPRFFTERDMATVSANVHNYTEEEQKIKVTIDAKGLHVVGEPSSWITVPAGGEKRVDWVCEVPKAGLADIKVTAQAKTEADAMARSYPIIPHGIEKFIAQAVVLKSQEPAEQTAEFVLNVPKERIKESTSLQLVLSPSMAAALLDALPYLADYPYGCVEQTMSRFLPAVIVAKTMQNLGLTEQEVMAYISDVMEPRHDPEGHPQRRDDATFTKLKSMTQDGLKRLYDFQHSDGGWGWWKDDDTNRFMTAYVLWGISLARDAGADVRGDVISRAASYLQTNLVEEENNPDMLAWMLYALAQARTGSEFQDKQEQRLWEMRDKLNPYTRALFALSLQLRNNKEYADVLVRNLANGVKEDKDNATAHWGESGIYYRWSDGGTEATAFVLKALVNIDPQSVYVDPAVKWLALNRRGARWSNTRDTAIALLSLADYLKTTRELNPAYEFDILVNGQSVRQGKVDSQNVLTFGRLVEVPAEAIRDGKNTVQVKFKGQGAMYLSGYLKYFTLEEGITSAGNEIFVERKYLKESKKETLMKGYVSDWAELKDGDAVKSGERIKVELTVEAKNNYEYLVFEDYKPAGFEAVELKSGTGYAQAVDGKGKPAGGQAWLYQEFRDQKVAIFITKLKQGTYRISYELRAEVPGEFHAMPNQAHAMYVPEIRANSSEMRLTVEERPEIE